MMDGWIWIEEKLAFRVGSYSCSLNKQSSSVLPLKVILFNLRSTSKTGADSKGNTFTAVANCRYQPRSWLTQHRLQIVEVFFKCLFHGFLVFDTWCRNLHSNISCLVGQCQDPEMYGIVKWDIFQCMHNRGHKFVDRYADRHQVS